MAPQPKAFISYRRDDSVDAAFHLNNALVKHFGPDSVFMDIDSIPLEVDFRKHIREAIERTDVVLAVIGNRWLDALDPRGERRLDDPADFVRLEIENAFELSKRVLPVLVGRAEMPRVEDLPPSLEALAFRNAASLQAGPEYQRQLPTEAEWEYACRAGTTTKWHCGDNEDELRQVAWYSENSGGTTHPVGEKVPNAWGLCDMHGNVWEWCKDWRRRYTAEDATDPVGPSEATRRVLRGGSWGYFPRRCRSAYRFRVELRNRGNFLGFRVVAVPAS